MPVSHRFDSDAIETFSTVDLISELKRRYKVLSRPESSCVILGPPLSGVSTQAHFLQREWGLCRLKREDFMHNGNTEVKTAIEKLSEEIGSFRCRRGFALENFPTNSEEARLLDEMITEKHPERIDYKTLLLDMPHDNGKEANSSIDILLNRDSGNLIHEPSGRIYNSNIANLAPQTPNVDDISGEPLTERLSNVPERSGVISSWWKSLQPPLEAYFVDRLEKIDASQPKDAVSEAITRIFMRSKQSKDEGKE